MRCDDKVEDGKAKILFYEGDKKGKWRHIDFENIKLSVRKSL